MNYEKLYFKFVESFKQQTIEDGEYTEKHHIIPRYAGGSDDEENLVKVLYRQHIFLHKLLYAWLKNPQDLSAVRLMSGVGVDRKLEICSMAGKIGGRKNVESGHMKRMTDEHSKRIGLENVKSGHLDRIRKFANNEVQKEKLKILCKHNVESGHLDKIRELAHEANRNRVWTDDQRQKCRENMLKRCEDPSYIEDLKRYNKIRTDQMKQESFQRSLDVLNTEQVFEEYLHMTPKKQSKYNFYTPTGLVFSSPTMMALYFGIPEHKGMLESWCKKEMNGWYCKLKSAQD